MNLFVPMQPGEAFDRLSILAVKVAQTTGSAPSAANLLHLSEPCIQQLGHQQYGEILASPEYQSLYQTNLQLFQLIDHMKRPGRPEDECHDVQVDDLNLARWKAKAALQTRFFPDAPLSEQKLGYGAAASTDPST